MEKENWSGQQVFVTIKIYNKIRTACTLSRVLFVISPVISREGRHVIY